MIKANELRIGNLIQGEEIGEVIKIDITDGRHILTSEEDGGGEDDFYPILLTEEWLLKFGFEWETEEKNHIQLSLPDKNLYPESKITFYQLGKSIDIHCQLYQSGYLDGMFTTFAVKYVHQLQNLYFSLTNEELTLKS